MGFSLTEYEEIVSLESDSTLLLTLKKLNLLIINILLKNI